MRGDRDGLPALDLRDAASRAEIGKLLAAHDGEVKDRHAHEERRLAYVALTRARSTLLVSGYAWDTTEGSRANRRRTCATLRGHVEPDEWFVPAPDATNPRTVEPVTASWPPDPLGVAPGTAFGRRAAVEAGAALVRDAAGGAARPRHARRSRGDADGAGTGATPRAAAAGRTTSTCCSAERERLAPRVDASRSTLPAQLSVSQLVELRARPGASSRSRCAVRCRARRRRGRAAAPRSTPGSSSAGRRRRCSTSTSCPAPPTNRRRRRLADLAELRAAFERSAWAQRTPAEVEVPFEMTVGGRVVRGRMDAVFTEADGSWLVVDWKTGPLTDRCRAAAAAVQLAAYRLAWARLRRAARRPSCTGCGRRSTTCAANGPSSRRRCSTPTDLRDLVAG